MDTHATRSRSEEVRDAVVDEFAIHLIRRKAGQLIGRAGFSTSESEDVEQELYLKLIKHLSAFDPTKATWHAFVKTIVERQAANLLRHKTAKKRHHGRVCSLSVVVAEPGEGRVELAATIASDEPDRRLGRRRRTEQESTELRTDLAEFLDGLPGDVRDLCERLKHDTISQVARDMGVPRTTLNEKIRVLRQRFEEAGLKAYLD